MDETGQDARRWTSFYALSALAKCGEGAETSPHSCFFVFKLGYICIRKQ